MTLIDEITAKCDPALIASKDSEAIAAQVSIGRTRIVTKLGGIGTVMETLGPVAGAALLDQLEAMAPTNSAVKWAFVLVNRGELDFGSPATRAMIDQLLPVPVADALKAVALVADPVSELQVRIALG